jgi:hypothetical protein
MLMCKQAFRWCSHKLENITCLSLSPMMLIWNDRKFSIEIVSPAIWHSCVNKPEVGFTQNRKHYMFVTIDGDGNLKKSEMFHWNCVTMQCDVLVWTSLKCGLHIQENITCLLLLPAMVILKDGNFHSNCDTSHFDAHMWTNLKWDLHRTENITCLSLLTVMAIWKNQKCFIEIVLLCNVTFLCEQAWSVVYTYKKTLHGCRYCQIGHF